MSIANCFGLESITVSEALLGIYNEIHGNSLPFSGSVARCSCSRVQAIRSKWRFITMTSACFRSASTTSRSLTHFSRRARIQSRLSSMKCLCLQSSEVKLGLKGKLQFPFMRSAWLRNEAHFRTGFPCKAHGWARSQQHHFQDESSVDSPSASHERSILQNRRACGRFTCCGKKLLRKLCFSVLVSINGRISVLDILVLKFRTARRSTRADIDGLVRPELVRSLSLSQHSRFTSIFMHAAWYWFHSVQ